MKKALLILLFASVYKFGYTDGEILNLIVGDSKPIQVQNAEQTTITDPGVVTFKIINEDEILISGKSAGTTKIVYTNTSGEKETDSVVVSAHSSKKPMIEVGVEIMEIDSQSALQAGLSWGSITSSGGSTSTTSNNLSVSEGTPPSLISLGTFTRDSLTANIQLLINRGKAKILSKPKLLTISGEQASFLAGGEIPYATANKEGATNVEWKPYGVKLNIKPTVDGSENIDASLRAEVSEIDNSNGIISSGIVIPALKTRWAETSVYMKSGNTLVIAGLIDEENQKSTSGIPLISDIPIIGELFRFTNDQKNQTELVIFVTPTLIGESNI
jgi:pilus assembly protein CpaC